MTQTWLSYRVALPAPAPRTAVERFGADVRAALEARDRAACGPVAPPQGLYLVGVSYPADPFAE